MKKLLIPTLVLCLMCMVASCSHSKKEVVETPYVETPSSQDSLEIQSLTVDYLEALHANRIEEAVAMFHLIRNDSVVDLPEDNARQLVSQCKMFPVLRYHVDDMKFNNLSDCEVYYTIHFFEKEPDDPTPNTMSFGLHPRKLKGVWYLTPLTK